MILPFYRETRTLLVALSLACLEMSFNVKGPGAVILLFRLGYKTSVVCHNVYTQKVKIARRDRLHILASNRCETFENLLHIDIAPLRSTLSGILHKFAIRKTLSLSSERRTMHALSEEFDPTELQERVLLRK